MADFPPNLEDGEKWLPSDVYEEIVSDKFIAEAHIDSIAKECVVMVMDEPVENFEHGVNMDLQEQQNHFWPVHMKGEEVKGFVGSAGTGVFLPCVTDIMKESKPVRGTAFSLRPSVTDATAAIHKKKKDGKSRQGTEKMSMAERGYSGKGQVENFEHGVAMDLQEQQNHFWPVHMKVEEVKGFVVSTGTGVFLPRVTDIMKECKPVRGTAVSLHPSATDANAAMRKSQKCELKEFSKADLVSSVTRIQSIHFISLLQTVVYGVNAPLMSALKLSSDSSGKSRLGTEEKSVAKR